MVEREGAGVVGECLWVCAWAVEEEGVSEVNQNTKLACRLREVIYWLKKSIS